MRKDLVSAGIEVVLDAIANGTFPEGEALPSEQPLAEFLDVSRPTMREIVRTLADRGVLEVVHGRGTFVRPRDQWRDVETLVEVWRKEMSPHELGLSLTEVRRMIEVGSCGHAAERRTAEDIAFMEGCLERFAKAHEANDIHAANREDVAFHNGLLRASDNPFLLAVMRPLQGALEESRVSTSSKPEVRERAARHHRAILDAVIAQDAEGAKNAMRAHMAQTREDL